MHELREDIRYNVHGCCAARSGSTQSFLSKRHRMPEAAYPLNEGPQGVDAFGRGLLVNQGA